MKFTEMISRIFTSVSSINNVKNLVSLSLEAWKTPLRIVWLQENPLKCRGRENSSVSIYDPGKGEKEKGKRRSEVIEGRSKVIEGRSKEIEERSKVTKGRSKVIEGRSKVTEGRRQVIEERRKEIQERKS